MIDYSQELNAEQLRVVQNGDGPCLVLAGAGSGKTRTITYRVAYLLENGVRPENILLVTFTNKAANEMKERVIRLMAQNSKFDNSLPWSGTFHHIAYRILKIYAPLLGYKNNFTVLDSDDSESLLKLCVKEIKSDDSGQRFPSARVIGAALSYSRNAEEPLQKIIAERWYQLMPFLDSIQEIARLYNAKKKEAEAMDFDDLLVNFLLLLRDDKIHAKFAAQFQYILVDEYQDTNKIQASIIRTLSSVHNNLLVVGDDAQSIYSFRAADIHNILGFELTYPGAKVFKLQTNYRSGQEILDLANNVIANNHEQYKKELRTITKNNVRPALFPQVDQESEARFIGQKIEEHFKNGIEPKEIAVLFRAASHSQMLEVELVQRGIPYDYRGGVRFFERAHIKDILAYLRIMNNLADTAAWLRVLMHEEGIGPAAAQKVTEAIRLLSSRAEPPSGAEGVQSSLPAQAGDPLIDESQESRDSSAPLRSAQDDGWQQVADIGRQVLGPKAQTGWNNFIRIWQSLIDAPARTPAKLIVAILESAYREYLEVEYIDSKDRLADIKQLALFAERYDDLDKFLAEMSLQESFRGVESAGGNNGDNKEKIILSTIHQAKGLEWGAVFIMNLSAGAFPSDRALKEDNGLEEERRLFYVAITRAKKFLYLTYPMAGGSFGDFLAGPSLFLQEINPELLEDHSLLVSSSTAFNDPVEDIEYVPEDRPKKIKPGSFLIDIDDL